MQYTISPAFRLLLSFGLTFLYHWFFWQEKLGLNLALFSGLLIVISLVMNREARTSRSVQLVAAGAILTGVLVVCYNSDLAKFAHLSSMFLLVGLIQLPRLQFLGNAVKSSLLAYLRLGRSLRYQWEEMQGSHHSLGRLATYTKLTLIPLLVLGIFSTLFYFANAAFGRILDQMGLYFESLFMDVSLPSILFFLSGFWVIGGLLFAHRQDINSVEQGPSNQLLRKTQPTGKRTFSFLALKREYRTGLLLVALVNGLLLLNNLLDVRFVWMAAEAQAPEILKQFVHEGTYLLIASILLSMGIMLYFFRGNLNFYRGGKWLRYLCYAWIVQNGFLLLSVGVRNYHFIAQYALAYKRIGVFFFLMLTLFGLFSLMIKIRDQMSGFYLWKANAWALWGGMMLFSLVNWDMYITRYNLNHLAQQKELDRSFLLELSDQTLPLVMGQAEILNDTGSLEHRKDQFLREQENYSWFSWNLADHRTAVYFEEHP